MDNHLNLITEEELVKIRDSFLDQLYRASQGNESDFSFLKTPLVLREKRQDGQFQVMVVGGSKFKEAHVRCSSAEIQIKDTEQSTVPVFERKETFLDLIHDALSETADELFINFAFPINPQIRDGRLDGILITGTKEHAFEGMQGLFVAEQVEKYIFEKTSRKIRVHLANDVVCLTASGLSDIKRSKLVGCIAGTGINLGFFLDEENIVNLESANFSHFQMSATGELIDQSSSRPGKHKFEKEISGAYLYRHFNAMIDQGIIDCTPISSTHELSDIAEDTAHKGSKQAQLLLERSAQYLACQIAAVYLFKNKQNIIIVAEGSLFWNGFMYRQNVEKYLKLLSTPEDAVSFMNIPSSDIVGAVRLMCPNN